MLLTKNSNSEVVLCSTRAIPAVCVYRPRRGAETVASNNLCSPPWFGYIIQGGQLTCFSLLQSVLPMNWEQAGLNCRYQHIGMAANVSMATFENAGKIHQWNAVRSSVYHTGTSQLKSAWIGLFWSESDGKFCWLNSEKNCAFQHFNWHPSANWTDGRVGIISNDTFCFSFRPNFSVAKVLHCESWVGWPRRFVRSEPVIVLRPDNSFVYVMMFDVLDGHGLQVDNQNNSINFRPDPLTDLSKRLERLGINGVTVQVTGHRWWNSKIVSASLKLIHSP